MGRKKRTIRRRKAEQTEPAPKVTAETIIFEDEWIAVDPQVRQLIEAVTDKPFPDPEKYYRVTKLTGSCHMCGCKTDKNRVDPYEDAVWDYATPVWICDDCHYDRWMDS